MGTCADDKLDLIGGIRLPISVSEILSSDASTKNQVDILDHMNMGGSTSLASLPENLQRYSGTGNCSS
jgi:hypothetical protein